MLRRRRLVAGAALAAAAPGLLQAQPLRSFAAGDPALRAALLAQGEAALRRGDPAGALEAFERAALMRHAADAEMGIVRAMVQEGGYRRALAFAAHAAGAHRDAPAASALYAWLLAAGGQPAFALRVLDESAARSAGDPLLLTTREALAQPMPVPPDALMEAPQRAAPHAVALGDEVPPAGLRGLASGALVDDGRAAIVPIARFAALSGADLWLRDGLGRIVRADIESTVPGLGVALLRPRSPMQGIGGTRLTATDPFAGTPAAVVAFAPSADGRAAWPWLFDGFAGPGVGADSRRRRLLVDLPPACGGAVWDAHGRLGGIALADAGRQWLPASVLRETFGAAIAAGPEDAPRQRPLPDELYERALTQVVQLLVPAIDTV